MFYHSGVIFAPPLNSETFAGHVSDKKSGLEKIPRAATLRRSSARLRKVRWTIYHKIRSNEKDVRKSLRYYKNLVKKFLKRFSVRLKSGEIPIWQEKLAKTAADVYEFLSKKEKSKSSSSHHVNIMVRDKTKGSRVGDPFDASSKCIKDENVQKLHVCNIVKKVENIEKVNTANTCATCSRTNYVVNLDSVLTIFFAFLHMVKNEPIPIKNYNPDFSKTSISEQNCSEFAYTEQTFDDEIDATVQICESSKAKEEASDPTETPVVMKPLLLGIGFTCPRV